MYFKPPMRASPRGGGWYLYVHICTLRECRINGRLNGGSIFGRMYPNLEVF